VKTLSLLAMVVAILPAPLVAQDDFPLCDLYPAPVAAQLLGRTVTSSVSDSGDRPWWGCHHQADGGDSSIAVNRLDSLAEVRGSMAAQSQYGNTRPIPNIGDAALLQVCGDCTSQVKLTISRGLYIIDLSLNTYPTPATPDLNALVAAVQPVLQAIDNPSTVSLPTVTPTVVPSSAPGGCDPALAAAVLDHLKHPDVQVSIDGGCHDLAITTNLTGAPLDMVPLAQQLCDSAAEVAFVGTIDSITVTAASGQELALGVRGQPCIGEL
jgi:hypothetical protein